MVIQPAVEVNPVVNTSSTEANGWRPDPGEQGPADAEIGSGLRPAQAANRESIQGFRQIILVHCAGCEKATKLSKP